MDKIDNRTKWTYCVGATGRDAAYTLVSMFLITYIQYTMGLTVAQYAAISVCVFLCLIWDAINDPMMGIIIENSHLKGGKFRPWILMGMLLNVVVLILLFTLRPQGWAFVVFFGIFYCLWGMTFTMNDISYWGMLPSLSSDPAERSGLLSLMSVFCCIGQFVVAGVVPTVVAGNAISNYRTIAFVVGLAFCLFQLLTFFGVKERPRVDEAKKNLSLIGMFKVIGRNDQLVHIGIATLLFNICNGLLIIFGVNFFYVEFGYSEGGGYIFLFTVMYGVGSLLSQALFSTIVKKFKRATLTRFFAIMIVIGYLLFLGIGYVIPKNVIIINAIGLFIFFCQGFFNMLVVLMLNNTIEYDEYKNHERHDSVVSSVRSFAVKLASAINQGISALVLIISGIYAIS
ncbi:MAG: glycoside-pentoside-hexuronide (GPH):cation symporter, partial [Lachnospiraceae bacterium]|nr:glycoside-pentoside-hexuronide (GPH):cation symporter [Lachnospiraceae bacterium]